jgi:NAD(P)H-quinone oxidoreductase subunit 2
MLDFSLLKQLFYLLPELVLGLGLFIVLGLTIVNRAKSRAENNVLMGVSLFFIVSALLTLFYTAQTGAFNYPVLLFQRTLTADLFSILMRGIILAGLGITVLVSNRFLQLNTKIVGDFYILVMGAALGGMILSSANDLMSMFVGLETLSITSYVLAGYFRHTYTSAEASFKYLLYGGAATGILLFGLSLLYGIANSTNFSDIALKLSSSDFTHPISIVLMVLVFSALAYKLSIAPFHMWTPDVYEGAPASVGAFLSVVSKTAALAVTLRMVVLLFASNQLAFVFWLLVGLISMTVGNLVALRQTNIKRLLAYSTIAHAGYMVLGIAAHSTLAISGILFYLVTYLFMNMGAFACVIYLSNLLKSEQIETFRGLFTKKPAFVFAFSILLLSLAGIPITAGFFGKFYLLQDIFMANPQGASQITSHTPWVELITKGNLWIVMFAFLNSMISLAYYINVIRLMVVKDASPEVELLPEGRSANRSFSLNTALAICVAMTLLIGIFSTSLYQLTFMSAVSLTAESALTQSQVPQGD